MKKKSKPTVLDLFSGCGGLSYGFKEAGFDIKLGIDNDLSSLKTFEANHRYSKALNIDLSDRSAIANIKKVLNGIEIDVVVGGPPCQGFSVTGTRNFSDKRNQLYLSLLKTVRELKPKAFIIENVFGMASLYGGAIKNEIIKRCRKMGYNVTYKVLLAADYGVPQMRKRLVFVGLRPEFGAFEFPKPLFTPDNYITCSMAIGDLPSRRGEVGNEDDKYNSLPDTAFQKKMRENSNRLYNHVATVHSQKVIDVISLVPEGGNYKSLPKGVGEHRKFNEAWTRYYSNKPSRTIDTGHRNHFHYKWNRVPTVRENARLQSFPDTFIFHGSKTQQYKQVGNAVPPLLSYIIAKKLLTYISSCLPNGKKIK